MNWFEAIRENTGEHFLDSGGAYGRHWQNPPVDTEAPAVVWNPRWWDSGATIETAHFLDATMEIDEAMQDLFEHWASREENKQLSWFEAGMTFCDDVLRLKELARDNVYNGENDLSQVYLWAVYGHDTGEDWLYRSDVVVFIHVHTGCDVRGGYGRPIFCRSKGDYAVPVDLCAEWYVVDSHEPVPDNITDRWQCGWSSYPFGEVRDAVERVFPWTHRASDQSMIVKLKGGPVCRIAPAFRDCQ